MNPLANTSIADYTLQTAQQKMQSADVYTDLHSLQKLKSMDDRDAALKQVAQQFESQFLHMMIKSMRDANAVFEKDSMFNSNESLFYRDMYDHQMSVTMAQGERGGIGIADAMYRQLTANRSVETSLGGQLPERDRVQSQTSISHSAGSTQTANSFATSPEEFVAKMRPLVSNAAKELGIKPDILIAQSALETGWGEHVIKNSDGSSSFNLFNIKANKHWQGDSVKVSTLEYRQNTFTPELAAFKSYASPQASVADYVALIKENPRYQQALNTDVKTYIEKLQQAGYATDPQYSNKVMTIHARIDKPLSAVPANGQG